MAEASEMTGALIDLLRATAMRMRSYNDNGRVQLPSGSQSATLVLAENLIEAHKAAKVVNDPLVSGLLEIALCRVGERLLRELVLDARDAAGPPLLQRS